MSTTPVVSRPPRDDLVRVQRGGYELVRTEAGGSSEMLRGHFAVFDEWTEIDSAYEGHFLERIAPGSFTKTFSENPPKVTFNHGHDPHLGDKVLGSIQTLREDERGGYYEVAPFEGIDPLLMSGLRAGEYGASFRFSVVREDFNRDPERSDHNPEGIPERTIREARVPEFGPVTFPAYAGATAGVRSLTDEYIFSKFTETPKRLAGLVDYVRTAAETTPPEEPPAPAPTPEPVPAPPSNDAGETHLEPEAPAPAETQPPEQEPGRSKEAPEMDASQLDQFSTLDALEDRAEEVQARLQQIAAEYGARSLPTEIDAEFSSLGEEKSAISERIAQVVKRQRIVEGGSEKPNHTETIAPPKPAARNGRTGTSRIPENKFDLAAYRQTARDQDDEVRLMRDGAKAVVEESTFPHPDATREDVQTHVDRLLRHSDDEKGTIARHILLTGSERYGRAFGKYLSGQARSPEEERALSLTTTAGGFAVPFTLDPTIIPTSNLAVNPFRSIARVEQIPGDEWRGISSAGITAAYAAEATETTDNAPTLAQPVISTEKAQAFIPFSIEVGMDWGGLQAEMARLLQDAKDELEATKFAVGSGTNEPQGVITGATTTTTLGGTAAFAIADLDTLEAALPPRFRARASWVLNRAIAQKVRHFDTSGAAGVWNQSLQLATGLPNNVPTGGSYQTNILGYPAYESTAMGSVLTTGTKIAILGDFRYYLIVDRIGLSVEVIPHLVGTNHRPTGQRGLYAYWRNGAGVLSASAFRVGVTG